MNLPRPVVLVAGLVIGVLVTLVAVRLTGPSSSPAAVERGGAPAKLSENPGVASYKIREAMRGDAVALRGANSYATRKLAQAVPQDSPPVVRKAAVELSLRYHKLQGMVSLDDEQMQIIEAAIADAQQFLVDNGTDVADDAAAFDAVAAKARAQIAQQAEQALDDKDAKRAVRQIFNP